MASQSLVRSLVIFASHRSPTLPPSHSSAVRVLRLVSPLAVEDTGAVRLVSILEWAERIARLWRASCSDVADLLYYDEATRNTPAAAPSSISRNLVNTTSGSAESLSKKSSSSAKGLSLFRNRRLSTSSTMSGLLSPSALPPVDPSQRPFDAILNYISHDVAEKHVLKQSILVTSITRPFLAPTLSPYHKLSEAKRHSRRKSTSHIYSLPPTPPYQPGDLPPPASSSITAISVLSASATPPPTSHMVHIIPPTARIGLVRSLDTFLSSFSQQPTGNEEVGRAKQYILNASTMQETVILPHSNQDECTILDLILFGGLDSVSGKSWIGSSQDILFLPTSASSSASSVPSTSLKPFRAPARAHTVSFHSSDPAPPRTRLEHSSQSSSRSNGSPPPEPRSNSRIPERSKRLSSDQDRVASSSLPPRLERLRHPQGPYPPSSFGVSSGKATRRSKLNMITQSDDQFYSISGLPTPPDSDEDARQASPQPRTPTFGAPTPQKKRLRWRFWKS